MTTCPSGDELRRLLDGDPEEEVLRAHVQSCPACRAVLDACAGPATSVTWGPQQPLPAVEPEALTRPGRAGASAYSPPSPPQLPVVPGYEILALIGRGGMGVVYRARQRALGRLVALKMPRAGSEALPEERARFRVEAEAVARLQHPNIVQIYEVGEHAETGESPRLYMALELVEGTSLARLIDGRAQPPRAAAELLLTLARAVQHAHDQGIVHRDLKPANVLLGVPHPPSLSPSEARTGGSHPVPGLPPWERGLTGEKWIPKITDFGLARQTEAPQDLTRTGVVLGTPGYMAPEQVSSPQDVGPLTDIYALGAILYELLTGRPPFLAATGYETLQQVTAHDPVPPRRLRPGVPLDLETICLTCLHREPARRYSGASALADDLDRFLSARPIRARRTGLAGRIHRWGQRNRGLACALAALALLLTLGVASLVAATVYYHAQEGRQRQLASQNAVLAAEKEARRLEAVRARDAAQQTLYRAEMHLAEQARTFNHAMSRVRELLRHWEPAPGRADLRGWEWYYLDSLDRHDLLTLRHGGEVRAVAWGPGGLLASAGTDGRVRLWLPPQRTPIRVLPGPPAQTQVLAWSPDGKSLAVALADGTVRLHRPDPGTLTGSWQAHPHAVNGLAWSPDGKRLATGGDSSVKIWDPETGKLLHLREGSFGGALAWSPDGTGLVDAGFGGVCVWNAADLLAGKPLADALRFEVEEPMYPGNASWSPDGRWLILGGRDMVLKQLDARTGRRTTLLRGHRHYIAATAWTPDNRQLWSASLDGTVRVWDMVQGRLLHTWLGHPDEVLTLACAPGGDRVASGGKDGTVKFWPTALPVLHLPHAPRGLAWSPEGDRLVIGDSDGTLRLIDRRDLHQLATLATGSPCWSVHWSPRGDLIAASCEDGSACIWSVTAGRLVTRLRGHRGRVRVAAWNPTGAILATLSEGEPVLRFWDTTGRLLRECRGENDERFRAAGWSPDGSWVAAAGDTVVRLWDARGQTGPTWRIGDAPCERLCWSPDGTRLATGDWAGWVHVWEVAHGRREWSGRASGDMVQALSWSPDGKRLASSNVGTGLQLWDPTDGKQAFSTEFVGELRDLAWSPDGSRLAAVSSSDRSLLVWDAAPSWRRQVSPELLPSDQLEDYLLTLAWQDRAADALAIAARARLRAPQSPRLRRLLGRLHATRASRLRLTGDAEGSTAALAEAISLYEDLVRESSGEEVLHELADLLLDRFDGWHVLAPVAVHSAGGANLTVRSDGRVLASGVNPDHDVYTVRVRPGRGALSALRLEALPDPSLPQHGCGRYPGNGNFLLGSLRVEVQGGQRVSFFRGFCDFEHSFVEGGVLFVQPGLSAPVVRGRAVPALLGRGVPVAWDTFPRQRERHTLVLETTSPVAPGNRGVTVTLDFGNPHWKQHALGQFRLSGAIDPLAVLVEWFRGPAIADRPPRARLALGYLLAGQPLRAETVLRSVVALPVERCLLAIAVARQGRKEEAGQLCRGLPEAARQSGVDPDSLLWPFSHALREAGVSPAEAADQVRWLRGQGVLRELTVSVARSPGEPGPLRERGVWYAQHGRWSEAAGDFVEAVRRDPGATLQAMRAAVLLLKAGKQEEYRRHTQALYERFRSSRDLLALDRTVKACLLTPTVVGEPAILLAMARRAATEGSDHICAGNFEAAAALACLRTGEWKDALTRARRARELARHRPEIETLAWVIEAWARDRGGEQGHAALCFRVAGDRLDRFYRQRAAAGESVPDLLDWVIADLLYQEAARKR